MTGEDLFLCWCLGSQNRGGREVVPPPLVDMGTWEGFITLCPPFGPCLACFWAGGSQLQWDEWCQDAQVPPMASGRANKATTAFCRVLGHRGETWEQKCHWEGTGIEMPLGRHWDFPALLHQKRKDMKKAKLLQKKTHQKLNFDLSKKKHASSPCSVPFSV